MLQFCSGITLGPDTIEESSWTDFVIGYARSLECFDQYVDNAMIDISCEAASNTEGGSGLIQKLKKIFDTVVNFFKNIWARVKKFIANVFAPRANTSTAKNGVKRGDSTNEYECNKVLGSWVNEIDKTMKSDSVTDENVYNAITKKYQPMYEQAKATGKTSAVGNSDKVTSETLACMGDEFNRLRRVQQFLTKLANQSGRPTTVASADGKEKNIDRAGIVKKAVDRGLKADINPTEYNRDGSVKEAGYNHKQPLIYLDNLIKSSGSKINIEQLRACVMKAIKFVKSEAHCVFTWIKYAVRYTEDRSIAEHNSSAIFKTYVIPQDVKNEISKVYNKMYPGSVGITVARSVIVASPTVYRGDWGLFDMPPKAVLKQAIMGFTMGGMNNTKGRGFVKHANVHINADAVLLSPKSLFLFVVGHELGHVSDNQHQKLNDKNEREYVRPRAKDEDDYKKNYTHDPMEQYANTMGARLMRGASPAFTSFCEKIRDDIFHIAKEMNYDPKRAIPKGLMKAILRLQDIIQKITWH